MSDQPQHVEAEVISAADAAQLPAVQRGAIRAVMQPDALAASIEDYRRIQTILDQQNPEFIVEISGRKHRTKGYWNAVALAFGLSVEMAEEERVVSGPDWGFLVTYRATAPNGSSRSGDGACATTEKRGPMKTVHNVRAHAHTRAQNRAISNLVGFGEVSADEINRHV